MKLGIKQTNILDCMVDAPVQRQAGQPALVEIRGKDYPINSIEEAAEKWNQIRRITQMGATKYYRHPIAVLDADRNYLGHIAYNGTFCSVQEEISYGIFRG